MGQKKSERWAFQAGAHGKQGHGLTAAAAVGKSLEIPRHRSHARVKSGLTVKVVGTRDPGARGTRTLFNQELCPPRTPPPPPTPSQAWTHIE